MCLFMCISAILAFMMAVPDLYLGGESSLLFRGVLLSLIGEGELEANYLL